MFEDLLVPRPEVGRVFRSQRPVRLADASPSRRLRFDACARYLQDVGNDDTADSGLDEVASVFVVRRAVVDVLVAPQWGDWVELATWCSGTGGRWAGRRLSLTSEQGARVEVDTLWIHLDARTLVPARLPEQFMAIYGPAAQGRTISSRHWLPRQPAGGDGVARRPWPLRFTDYDVMGHVNNAAYWDAVEEVLAEHRDHPAHPRRGPVRAALEFGAGIPRDAKVELQVAATDTHLDVWFTEDATTHATARIAPI